MRDQKLLVNLISRPHDLPGAVDHIMKDLIEFVVLELAIDCVPNAFRILKTEPFSPETRQLSLIASHHQIGGLPRHCVISDKPLRDLKLLIEIVDVKCGFSCSLGLPKNN